MFLYLAFSPNPTDFSSLLSPGPLSTTTGFQVIVNDNHYLYFYLFFIITITFALWEERLVKQVENQPKRMLKSPVNMRYLFLGNEIESHLTEGQLPPLQNGSNSHLAAL